MAHDLIIASSAINYASPFLTIEKISSVEPVSFFAIETSQTFQVSSSVGKPTQLLIPSININTNIEHIGLTADGAVGAPEGAREVSWFNAGFRPGEKGNALISGHYGRWKNGTDSVFNLLPTLQSGDLIYVKDDQGTTRSFKVKATRIYGKNDSVPELFEGADTAQLNLISCYGEWILSEQTYSKRFVVFAQML